MKKLAVAAVLFLFIFTTVNAQEEKYTNDSVARLSHFTGNIYIQKATDLEYEEGVVNMPISEGDRVGTTDGRAEIFLGKGNYIRLDKNTKVDFERLPKHGDRLFRFQVWSGNIYLSIGTLENEKDFEIHTSDVALYILDNGLYRIDVRSNIETEIFVFSGLVEAAGESGSMLIKEEQRLEATEGHFTSRPTSFFASANDSFDRWNQNRDSILKRHLAKQYLPNESWGWVSWFWGTDTIGWSPMSYWGYPGVFINNRYYGRYKGQSYPYNSGSLTVIRKNQLKARNVSKVSLSQKSIQNLGKFRLNNQKPTFIPTRSTFDIQKLKATTRPAAKQSVKLDSTRIKKFKSYPSTGSITAKKYSSSKPTKKPSSAISRIYQRISKRSGTISKGRSRSTSSRSSSARPKSSKSGSSSSSRVKKIKK